ncbi:hypothetical protein [Tumidithrix helvetica]
MQGVTDGFIPSINGCDRRAIDVVPKIENRCIGDSKLEFYGSDRPR